jgi:hypothetical protein
MGERMFARFAWRQFTHAIGHDTHVALLGPVRAILRAWGLQREGMRNWKLAPYVEGVDGVEAELLLRDEVDQDALPALARFAEEAGFDLLLSRDPVTPAAAWIGSPLVRRTPPARS